MVQKIIHRLLRYRHFWRQASFSEIAELYAARVLRMLAIHMTAAFTSIYLYQSDYGVGFIALYWMAFFAFKAVISLPAAAVVAYIGPKHAILISNLLFIPAMIALAMLTSWGPGVLVVVLLFQAVSSTIYQIAHSVDFSKVKSLDHAGKEIAYMNIAEKVTTGLSPLIGGLLALVLGPEIVIAIAAVLFLVAALPLLRTKEPITPRQKLTFKGMPWHLVRGNILSEVALGYDVFTSTTVWTLFYAIAIIGITSSDTIYAANGILLSVVLLSALAASYIYGRLIDNQKGRRLMVISTFASSLSHIVRPLVGSPLGVAALNVANEAAHTGYAMAYTRGILDNADLSGRRVAYLGVIEGLANFGAGLGAATLALLTLFIGEIESMEAFFLISAGVVLLVMTARFPLYKR